MTTQDVAVCDGQLAQIPVSEIRAGSNDRKAFDPVELRALADSIARDGLAQPPTVRRLEVGGFEIVAGERRVRAMRDLLGWSSVPAFVRTMSDQEASALMLVENMVRVDLDPVEEAKAYSARVAAGSTVVEVADLVGVTARTVRNRLDLLRLAGAALALISSGQLQLQFAAQMVGLDSDRQGLALRALAHGSLGAPAFTALCDRLRREQEAEPMFSADLFWSVEEYNETALREAAELVAVRSGLASADPSDMLSTAEAAARAGIMVGSVRRLVVRGTFPRPDGHVGVSPWWRRSTVDRWLVDRRPSGRPRQLPLSD